MREVAPESQTHAQKFIARLEHCHVNGHISLGARMGLHVHVVSTEKLLGTLYCQVFSHVHILAASIVTTAGVAFGIFVSENGALCFEHSTAHVVLGGD